MILIWLLLAGAFGLGAAIVVAVEFYRLGFRHGERMGDANAWRTIAKSTLAWYDERKKTPKTKTN